MARRPRNCRSGHITATAYGARRDAFCSPLGWSDRPVQQPTYCRSGVPLLPGPEQPRGPKLPCWSSAGTCDLVLVIPLRGLRIGAEVPRKKVQRTAMVGLGE